MEVVWSLMKSQLNNRVSRNNEHRLRKDTTTDDGAATEVPVGAPDGAFT